MPDIIDEIRKYYMNPKKYPNENKKSVENAILQIDESLKNQGTRDNLLIKLCEHYTSKTSDSIINSVIRQSRADEEGLSATRGYREIYFNEIIQNANDNTTGTDIDIILAYLHGENTYSLTFSYEDTGFLTENIIGLFNTEIHTKRNNISATGKHGVGIKSLFYFVDYLKIESNIIAEFKIDTTVEDGIEKVTNVSSSLAVNNDWNREITKLVIKFRNKDGYGEFNVQKLKKLIILCEEDKTTYEDVARFFFGVEQKDLIFDVRALIFTDKNRNKENGINNMHFFDSAGNEKFTISCVNESGRHTDTDEYFVEKSSIKFNEDVKLSFIVFTHTNILDENEQTFSVAFPQTSILEKSGRRYYETYYIPEAKDAGINLLINSKYSSIDRRRLTDDEEKKKEILDDISFQLINIYKYMVSDKCQENLSYNIKKDISVLFHQMLILDADFVDCCFENAITNRYLVKFKEVLNLSDTKYISYCCKNKGEEAYEKKLIGQKYSKDDFNELFNKLIIKDDTIVYNKENYLEEIVEIYNRAFDENEKLCRILNVVGTIEKLIYLRVNGIIPVEQCFMLKDSEMENWLEEITYGMNSEDLLKISYIAKSIIGRYKLHPYTGVNGEITGASFYEYLFNSRVSNSRGGEYSAKQKEMYENKYGRLKEKLQLLKVNREESGIARLKGSECRYPKGTIAFFASWDRRAGCDTYFDVEQCRIYDYVEKSDTEKFGTEDFELLMEKIGIEANFKQHIKLLCGKIMLCSSEYPSWGYTTSEYERTELLVTGKWFYCTFININFIKNIIAKTWGAFQRYLTYLIEHKDLFSEWGANKEPFVLDANCEVSFLNLISLYTLYYENGVYEIVNSFFKVNLVVKITDEVKKEQNLCPADFCEYLKKLTGLDVFVIQSNTINFRKKEILYADNKSIHILSDFGWQYVGTVKNNSKIIIIHNEKSDWKEAVCKVLENILNNKDILEKCEAFLPANQLLAIHGCEYENVTNQFLECDLRVCDYSDVIDVERFTCKQLVHLITARGNNDNKCGCCGKALRSKNLIITNNTENDTKQIFPQIVNVVCDNCSSVLKKSHERSRMFKQNNKYFVEYICRIQNSHQDKKVFFQHEICSGVRALCTKKS